MTTRLSAQPSVLEWARRTAHLSIEEAAHRANVPVARMAQWEAGERSPTVVQLRKIADTYSRPFAALLMKEPPADDLGFDLPDYRRQSAAATGESVALRKAILRAKRQQDALRSIDAEGSERLLPEPISVVVSIDSDPSTAGAHLREHLSLDSIPARVLQNPEEMLREVVRRAESLGNLVIQVQSVNRNEMRGFSIADDKYPLIALNGADAPRGKIYSLLHELVHLGLRESGLCDLKQQSESRVERFCDEVAAAALMPATSFTRQARSVSPGSLSALKDLGSQFGASAEATLLRMVHLKMASWDTYNEMRPDFQELYDRFRNDMREANASSEKPIYYQLKVRDLGRPFIRSMVRALDDGTISSRDATQLLEVSFDKLPRLATQAGVTF